MADAAVARQLQFAFAAADSTPAQRPCATPSALSPAISACTAGSTASQHGQRAWARASQVHHSSPGIGSASVVHAAQAHAAATPASTSWTTFSQGQSFAFSARHHVHTERSAAASPSPAGGRLSGSSSFRGRAAAGREAPAFVRYGLPAGETVCRRGWQGHTPGWHPGKEEHLIGVSWAGRECGQLTLPWRLKPIARP